MSNSHPRDVILIDSSPEPEVYDPALVRQMLASNFSSISLQPRVEDQAILVDAQQNRSPSSFPQQQQKSERIEEDANRVSSISRHPRIEQHVTFAEAQPPRSTLSFQHQQHNKPERVEQDANRAQPLPPAPLFIQQNPQVPRGAQPYKALQGGLPEPKREELISMIRSQDFQVAKFASNTSLQAAQESQFTAVISKRGASLGSGSVAISFNGNDPGMHLPPSLSLGSSSHATDGTPPAQPPQDPIIKDMTSTLQHHEAATVTANRELLGDLCNVEQVVEHYKLPDPGETMSEGRSTGESCDKALPPWRLFPFPSGNTPSIQLTSGNPQVHNAIGIDSNARASSLYADSNAKTVNIAEIPKDSRVNDAHNHQNMINAADPPRDPQADRSNTQHHKVELPYQVTHAVVSAVQSILEEALFDFATKHIPRLLQAEGWVVPVQGELSQWDTTLRHYKGDINFAFRAHNVNCSPSALFMKLARLRHLRHTSVHRLQVSISWLRRWMVDAVEMSQCLGACLGEPSRFNKLRVIEVGVWPPHTVDLEEVLSKPLNHFIGDKVPERKEYLDPVLAADVRVSGPIGPTGRPGERKTFMKSPPPPRSATPPRPPPPTHVDKRRGRSPHFPQLGQKRARTPSPDSDGPKNETRVSKRRRQGESSIPDRHGPANRTRAMKQRRTAQQEVKTRTFIDLTEDDQDKQDGPVEGVSRVKRIFSALGSILTSGKIIDLTED